MSSQVEQKRRELFEAWAKSRFKRYEELDSFIVRWMFEAYCAAIDAAVIELPVLVEPTPPEDALDDSWRDGYSASARYRKSCIAAIESTGLGLKVLP